MNQIFFSKLMPKTFFTKIFVEIVENFFVIIVIKMQ